jgi:ubiquinone/menaquinone biosynthesis C-methylase UbiE
MILDVGCGDNPRGTVNVDKFRFSRETRIDGKIVKTSVDVIATGEYLPFKDNAFEEATSTAAIEHGAQPFKFLSEMVRVSPDEMHVRTAYLYGFGAKRAHHKSYSNAMWFVKDVEKLHGKNLSVKPVYHAYHFILFSIFRKPELIVRFQKGCKK